MSAGPWKSEPAPHRARATIVTNGNAERRYRHVHVAREAFDRLTLGGGFAALFVRRRGRWLMTHTRAQ